MTCWHRPKFSFVLDQRREGLHCTCSHLTHPILRSVKTSSDSLFASDFFFCIFKRGCLKTWHHPHKQHTQQRFLEAMVGGALARASALHVGLGVGGTTIASGSRVRTFAFVDFRLLISSCSLDVSSLFCRATQCM